MENDFLKDLNPQQRKAVLHTEGPMIILAGAGSGKTKCITYKVMYLIEKHINPENILCITFTNKAAGEMKERIEKFLFSGRKPLITTFHSFCAKILRIDICLSFKIICCDLYSSAITVLSIVIR